MMRNDITDNEIFARIKQSLDSYQEDYIPGSWENFLLIQKRRKRIFFLRIASGIAACLIVGFLGFNFLNSSTGIDLVISNQTSTNISSPEKVEDQKIKEEFTPASIPASSILKQFTSNRVRSISPSISKQGFIAEREDTTPNQQKVLNNLIDSSAKKSVMATNINLNITNKVDTVTLKVDTIRGKHVNTLLDSKTTSGNEEIAAVNKRKIRFGLNLSPGLNSTQSASTFNYMGGVSADIPLFANFELSTGIQIENQMIMNKTQGMTLASSSNSDYTSLASNKTVIPSSQMEIKLINLDLPVNITWKFINEKTHAYYVSAGLSSLVYLKQENKNTIYSQQLVPAASSVVGQEVKSFDIVSQVNVTQNIFTPNQVFDFAGRLNIILGVERKLSKRFFIHLEPYAKIPVAGQASENLKHTSTGINFKVSF